MCLYVYERRDECANAIFHTMENLNVPCTFVNTASEFFKKLISNEYQFAFIAFGLYEIFKKTYPVYESTSMIILVEEFGESVSEQNLTVLYTPIYSLPVANILNNVLRNPLTLPVQKRDTERFTAPAAKILIVDDIKTNLVVAKGIMAPYQMQIDTAISGKEAIEVISQNRYDLVFMDHKMPDMDGIETTQYIRALGKYDPYYRNLPIIALTANVVYGVNEMFLKNGFNDFLSKPIEIKKLNAVLEKWIPKGQKNVITHNDTGPKSIMIDGLDVEQGIKLSGGSYEFYLEILAVFYEDGIQKIDEINDCIANNKMADYPIYVHALKSAATNIGAGRLAEAAGALEAAGARGDINYIQTHNTNFLADLKIFLTELNEYI